LTTCLTCSCWPVRRAPLMEGTAASRSPRARSCLSMKVESLQLCSKGISHLDDQSGAVLQMFAFQDLRFTLMQLGDQIPTVIGNEHLKLDAWSWNRGADLFQQRFGAFTGVRRNDGGVRLPVADAFDDKRISHVSLVHHDDLRDVQRVDFAQHSAYCLNLPFRVRVGPVYNVQDQIRI